ncbi:hypothetical protein L804_00864 [Cryptococcus deuterogattii 2001/935-1]|nr:hypothetical protein L804_00864 [Cryptococcus deuterogattii 2001/935-1]
MTLTSTFSSSETLHTIPLLPLATFLKTLTSVENVARLQDVLVKHRSLESWERVDERMTSSGDLPPPGCTPKPQVNLSDETNDDIGARDQNQNQEPDQDEDEESEERMESDRDPGIVYPSPPKTYIQETRVDLRTLHPKAIFALESWRRETLGMEQLVMESREFAASVNVGADAKGEGDCASPGVSYLTKSVRLSNLDILFRGDREKSESTSMDETSSVEVTPIPVQAKPSALVDVSSQSAPAKRTRIFKTYGSSKRLSSLSLSHSGFPTRIASLSPIGVASASPLLSPTLSEAEPENKKAGSRRIVGRERLRVVNASKEVSEQGSVAKKRGRGRLQQKAEGLSQPVPTFVELVEEIPTKSDGVEGKEEGKRGKERQGRRKASSSRSSRLPMPLTSTSKTPDIFEGEEELESFSSEQESEIKKPKRTYRCKEKDAKGEKQPKKRGRPRKSLLVFVPPNPADMSLSVNRPAKGTFARPIEVSIPALPINSNAVSVASSNSKSTSDSRNISPSPSAATSTLPRISSNPTLLCGSTSSTSSSSRPQSLKRKSDAKVPQAAEFESGSELTELSEMSELETRPQSQSHSRSRSGSGSGPQLKSQSKSRTSASASAYTKRKSKFRFDGVILPSFSATFDKFRRKRATKRATKSRKARTLGVSSRQEEYGSSWS